MKWPPIVRASFAAITCSVAVLCVACGGGGGCLSFTGCGSACSEPSPSQRWRANFAAAPSAIVDPNAAVLEAQVRVGGQVSLLLLPVGTSNICLPEASWTSTNPSVGGFQNGNPNAGTYTAPFGDAVFFAISPGSTTIYVTVRGVRYDLFYNSLGKPISAVHVVP